MVELIVGRYYNIKFYSEDYDINENYVEEFLGPLRKNSGHYRLIGGGSIPSKYGEENFFYFKHCETNKILELDNNLFINCNVSNDGKFIFYFNSDKVRYKGEYDDMFDGLPFLNVEVTALN